MPESYNYPPLLMYATVAGGALLDVLPGGESVGAQSRATIDFRYQAIIQSQDLIRAGRLAVLLFAAGTVLVTALLAARLVGRRAAVVAGIIAATMPALVTRSAIVVVDTPAAFFATACLLCVAYMRTGERPVLWASAAGAAAGFGTASKYPTGVVIFAVLTVIALWRDRPIEYRLKLAGAAVVVAGIAAIVGAPTLLFRAHTVLSELRTQSHIYASKTSIDSYWDSLRDGREVGPLLLVVSAVFAVALAGPLLRYPFQPLRNVLPLLPFLCVAAAAAIVETADAVAKWLHIRRSVRTLLIAAATIALCVVMAVGGGRTYVDHITIENSHVQTRRRRLDGRRARILAERDREDPGRCDDQVAERTCRWRYGCSVRLHRGRGPHLHKAMGAGALDAETGSGLRVGRDAPGSARVSVPARSDSRVR